MARKLTKTTRESARAERPSISPTSPIRKPSSSRVVTSRVLRERASDPRNRAIRREVPEIRLSGAWLERVGFPKGRRYLVSADRPFETIILQALHEKPERQRRR